MRRAFTLLELLTVIGMMSLLGAVSVVAGVSVTRGMEDRAARQSLEGFLRNAARIASAEGRRIEVIFRRYELAETEDDSPVEVCRATAVRSGGRITGIEGGRLWDEFAEEGFVALDGMPDVVLPEGDVKVGMEYGVVIATLELPRDYTVTSGRIRFLPREDGTVQQEGNVRLLVRRASGIREELEGDDLSDTGVLP